MPMPDHQKKDIILQVRRILAKNGEMRMRNISGALRISCQVLIVVLKDSPFGYFELTEAEKDRDWKVRHKHASIT